MPASQLCVLKRSEKPGSMIISGGSDATRLAILSCEQFPTSRVDCDASVPVKDLCRKHGFSEASYYLRRSKFGGMGVSDARRLKALKAENAKLKKLLAESALENEVAREALRKKW